MTAKPRTPAAASADTELAAAIVPTLEELQAFLVALLEWVTLRDSDRRRPRRKDRPMPTQERNRQAPKAPEQQIQRGVPNPYGQINPRGRVGRPNHATPLQGPYCPPPPANCSQNPRGGY
jgi:hypothetical protein